MIFSWFWHENSNFFNLRNKCQKPWNVIPPTTKNYLYLCPLPPPVFIAMHPKMSLSLCIILLIDSSYTKSLLLKNLRDFYLKYKSLRTSRRSCHHPQQHCCPGIAHSPFLSWVLLLLRLSDQAQIWLPLAMINDFSYPQRLRS